MTTPDATESAGRGDLLYSLGFSLLLVVVEVPWITALVMGVRYVAGRL
jgi:hypothetical protein